MNGILFSLLIQQGLCDSQGRVWRNHSKQLYAIEVTLPEVSYNSFRYSYFCDNLQYYFQTISISELSVLEMLPQVNCLSPRNALSLMKSDSVDANEIMMNENEFKSDHFQRVYQYLHRHSNRADLDRFSYSSVYSEGNSQQCIKTILA